MEGIDVLRRAGSLLPPEPGVYRFRDRLGRTIYIGRATDLRSRVRSYAGDLRGRSHLRRMVPQVHRVEAIVCASVPEAGWLERNLLERSLPRWNRIRGGMELVGWLAVNDDVARPAVDLVLEGADRGPGAAGPYLGVERLALARSALLRAWPMELAGERLPGAARSMAAARGVSPRDLTGYATRIRAVLAGDEQAIAELRSLLAAASRRAVDRLAFETALRIQAEVAAVDWLIAPQRVAGCSRGLVVGARADGVEFRLAATGDRLDQWTTGRTSGTGTHPADGTPREWHAFAIRNAELAAELGGVS